MNKAPSTRRTGIGKARCSVTRTSGDRRATIEYLRAHYECPAAVAEGSADQGVAGGKIPIPIPIPSTS